MHKELSNSPVYVTSIKVESMETVNCLGSVQQKSWIQLWIKKYCQGNVWLSNTGVLNCIEQRAFAVGYLAYTNK